MTDIDETIRIQTQTDFQTTLNRHGYGFQYSVLDVAKRCLQEGKSRWLFEAAEFPVEVQGKGTRIDFILRRLPVLGLNGLIYMVAECKRVNPALANWNAPTRRGIVRNLPNCS